MKTSPLKPFLIAACLFGLLPPARVCGAKGGPVDAAESVIAEYRSDAPSARVKIWRSEITHPSGNPKFKEFQAERLREWETTEFAKHRLDDPQINALVAEVIRPALALYRRENCFKLLVVEHEVPVAMNDSAVLLMLTTGVIERANSDDDILGHVAHEVGHDIHWRRTARARQTLELYEHGAGTELLARRAREELAKIELECDAFSSVTLAAIGRSPSAFGKFLSGVTRDFPDYVLENMPPDDARARVIERVVPAAALSTTPRQSEALKKLKALLEARRRK